MVFQNLDHMKTNDQQTVEKSSPKNTLFLVLLFSAVINLSFIPEGSCANSFENDEEYALRTSELIKTSLNECHNQVVWLDGIELQTAPLIYRFYEINDYQAAWTTGNELTDQSTALIELLKDSYKYGFEPTNFDIVSLERFSRSLTKDDKTEKSAMMRVRFEFLLTNSVFAFMSHLTQGAELSNAKNAFIIGNPLVGNFPKYLSEIKSASEIIVQILKLQPKDSEYTSLRNEMEVIISNMGTTNYSISVPDVEEDLKKVQNLFSYIFLKEGIISENVDLSDQAVFTLMLIEFQDISGIRTTGNIDKATRRIVSDFVNTRYGELAHRIEQIRHRSIENEKLISFNH